jgi:hypothetical protein
MGRSQHSWHCCRRRLKPTARRPDSGGSPARCAGRWAQAAAPGRGTDALKQPRRAVPRAHQGRCRAARATRGGCPRCSPRPPSSGACRWSRWTRPRRGCPRGGAAGVGVRARPRQWLGSCEHQGAPVHGPKPFATAGGIARAPIRVLAGPPCRIERPTDAHWPGTAQSGTVRPRTLPRVAMYLAVALSSSR